MSNIYAVKHPHGFYKIGRSKNPIKRYQTLRIGSPFELELEYILSTNCDGKQLEADIHAELQDYHWRGEWFNIQEAKIQSTFSKFAESDSHKTYHLRKTSYVKSSGERELIEKAQDGDFSGFESAKDIE